MKRTASHEYLRTKVLTATPAELRMMLLDGAVRFAEKALEGAVARDYERMYEGATRAQAILVELINGLDPKHDPELCKRLAGLYTYIYTRLVTGTSQREESLFREACELLRYERETWQLLMTKLASDSPAAPTTGSTERTAEPVGAGDAGTRVSVHG